jgi:hypothetical protein
MTDIIIESQNLLDLREEDIKSLAQALAACFPGYRFGYAYYPPRDGMFGVTWWEVVRIWLPDIAESLKDKVVGALVALAVDWARRRFRRKDAPKRPKYVAIYGPNGQVITSVLVKDDTLDAENQTEHDRKNPPMKMPPIQGYFDDLHKN